METKVFVKSMLDDDLYKLTQQQAFMELFPSAKGVYKFTNRGEHRFNQTFIDLLKDQIFNVIPKLRLNAFEATWLRETCPFLKPWYIDFLLNYSYNPEGVEVGLTDDGNLEWSVEGYCYDKMMWEVKMMAIISELYFKVIETNWNYVGQEHIARRKARMLSDRNCVFVDFGTRRRRSFQAQNKVVEEMKRFSGFRGTSNVYLSMIHGLKPKGTQAHEWFMAMQALEGIRNSNYYALNNWVRVYNGDLGIALPDTIGLDQFLNNFSLRYAKLFDGVRWDSGDPFWFVDKMVNHYKKLGIDPETKTIVFSNALDCHRAVNIKNYCEGKIKCSFGIGTYFTNDFVRFDGSASKALNMVIKLWSVNGIPVVKISDDKGKVMGDRDAIRVTNWIINGVLQD